MPAHPNFLVILSDQHNPHNLGCTGDARVRTPHLDDLARRGVLFDNTYCASPLCVPSRSAILTGTVTLESIRSERGPTPSRPGCDPGRPAGHAGALTFARGKATAPRTTR